MWRFNSEVRSHETEPIAKPTNIAFLHTHGPTPPLTMV